MEYEEYLAGLDESALAALLRARPDVLVEPVPRGLAALAQRLCSASSLVIALQTLNRDQLVVGEAITAGRLERLDQALLPAVLDQLRTLGLLWGPDLQLPPLLTQHWSMDRTEDAVLTGRPELPLVRTDAAAVHRAAQAAASALLDGVTSLLDKATAKPITALKKGGIGTKEVSRLARELAVEPETAALWLDLAGLSGLLGDVEEGFAPTTDFPRWRDLGPARRWTDLAEGWLAEAEHGPMRRALLTAAAGGVSVRAAADGLDWFCPMVHEDDVEQLVRDAETLGLVALDVLTDLGEFLAGRRDGVDDLLPEQAAGVILQSDLTAIVAGPPPRVILAAAEREAGAVWRFSATSVRAALDAGWTAEDLLAELGPAPQPLTYLINDVDRRHGHVRVREVRCCVVADEATATEIAHRLKGFSQLAPTVLSSSDSPANVLALLRNAGYAPVTENHAGTVVVEHAKEHMAQAIVDRTAVTAEELAARLIAEPHVPVEGGATFDRLSRQNHTLHPVELAMLAHAIDTEGDVVIGYRDRNGNRTVRRIRPEQLLNGWLDSWCYLREDEREFAVANIESVEAAW
ncbi:helicase-associated domain-containing protein [Kutzneria buriramensis]|uniref:XPB/Ssl2-like helicase family protein n=1 Tax=Kutzneria buriramensis TaxID=1045776 RepID=A0A3E0I950_9PSEU|nr:helicase-associated domain-containing protein [Kutzneria buriramensis]REH55159.1 XPB/Ssl2-like helicase family protein [Kutzneria buriramensis]